MVYILLKISLKTKYVLQDFDINLNAFDQFSKI